MTPTKINFKIYQGSTFKQVLRWESSTKTYAAITSISKSAPMVVTAIAHGLPLGWRARVTNAGGMKEANSLEYQVVTDTTTDTVTFNQVNSLGFTPYTTGGVLEYNTPVPFSEYSARMQIRPNISSDTIIHTATSDNGELILDSNQKSITIEIPASTTSIFSFSSAVYSMELYNTAGEVLPFLTGNISLVREVTR